MIHWTQILFTIVEIILLIYWVLIFGRVGGSGTSTDFGIKSFIILVLVTAANYYVCFEFLARLTLK